MKQVNILVHRADEAWWAESPELAGLTVAADSRVRVEELAREAVVFHLADTSPSLVDIRVVDVIAEDAALSEGL